MRLHAPIFRGHGRPLPTESTHPLVPYPTGNDSVWIPQAKLLETFVCDAVFHIAPSFYVGPDNGMTSLDWATANIRLPPPNLPRQAPDEVMTAELIGREDELVGHYRRVVAIVEAHGKPASLRQPFPYFRTEPAIIVGGEMLTAFSWNDDLYETQTVLAALAEPAGRGTRLLWDDQDQGWRILIVAAGAVTCFIEWDAEGAPPTTGGYTVDAASLAQQAGAALDRLRMIHSRLVRALGYDYWSNRRAAQGPPPGGIRVRFHAVSYPANFMRNPWP
jgi:hypothetical protein